MTKSWKITAWKTTPDDTDEDYIRDELATSYLYDAQIVVEEQTQG